MFTLTVVVAEFPATSVAVPLKTWFKPVVVTLIGLGQFATPDSASEHANVMVTGVVVLIPFAFGAGEMEAVIVGGVLSMLSVAHEGAVFPAASNT
jgi:hypothetical protein